MNIPKQIIKAIAGFAFGKSYTGVLNGNLPSSQNWGSSDYLNAHEISLYTNRAIAKRAEKVGEVKFQVKDKNGVEVPNHPILKVLNYPNDVFPGARFWSLYQTYLDVLGCAYIVMESSSELFEPKKLTGLHILKPTNVTLEFGTDGKVSNYKYASAEGKYTTYSKEQVIYIFRPDPKNPMYGVSLLKAGITAIQTEIQIGEYHAKVIANGGKVEGVFKFKTPRITKEQLGQLKDQYNKDIAEARNSGTPLFLGGDADYTRMGLTPDELSFLEAKKTTFRDVCIMTGVPAPLLAEFSEMQYSNADVAVKMFQTETNVPNLKILCNALDTALLPDGETLTFDDPTPENEELELKETESGLKNYYMTINEARARHGLESIGKDGDVILVPFNLIPLGQQSVVQSPSSKALDMHPLRDAETRKMYYDIQNKRIDARSKQFDKVLSNYLDGQRDRIMATLSPTKTRVYRKAGLFDDTVQIELEVKIGKEAFLPVLEELVRQAGDDALALVGSSYNFHMGDVVTSWFTNRADVFIRQINETTFNKLAKEFERSFEAGENRDQLIERVQNTYQGISEGRANVIARTETHNATQYGTMEGYKQAGMNIKIWASVKDTETRGNDPHDAADHLSMDGEERPIGQPFSNGLMYPGDPRGSAAEVINCRCVI